MHALYVYWLFKEKECQQSNNESETTVNHLITNSMDIISFLYGLNNEKHIFLIYKIKSNRLIKIQLHVLV